MDRSLKGSSRLSAAEWEALLARIQSPSRELEASLAKSNSNLIEALSGLEELEKLTQMHLSAHLAPPTPALPPSSLPSVPAAGHSALPPHASQAPAKTQAPDVSYQTSHEEYAPALHQSALVEALLQYQRKKALRTPKSGTNAGTSRAPATQDIDTPAFSRSEFVQMKIPAIHAEPKAAPLGRAAAPSARLPVLRLKNEMKSGTPNLSGNSDDQED